MKNLANEVSEGNQFLQELNFANFASFVLFRVNQFLVNHQVTAGKFNFSKEI